MCASAAASNIHIDNEQIVLVYACYHLKASRNWHNSSSETGRGRRKEKRNQKKTMDTRLLTMSNYGENAECTAFFFLANCISIM